MKIAVRHYTKSGNTKRVADAIAEELGVQAKPVSVPLEEHVDVLFLCNSMYWAGIDPAVRDFVASSAGSIGAIANVSTAAIAQSTYGQMRGVARRAGVTLLEDEFHCRGQFATLHAGHPDASDLEAARAFARGVCSGLQGQAR